eukprot:TRINITY_DN17108_c0_g1_i1.p1 TRINITY_DN17108_c0_g1~~TRINITY_DN17108_c0_g1_i1.p1  ORF type:complete len:572 (+),score=23.88 TRINITY_DN17108_c0_g1_i1:48-1718(+)
MGSALLLCVTAASAASTYSQCSCKLCGGSDAPHVWDWDVDEGPAELPPGVRPGGPRPFQPKTDLHVRRDTPVHVLLSSFRDPRCGQSVYNVFSRARYPQRMHVGIVQQNLDDKTDPFDCVAVYCSIVRRSGNASGCPHLDRISILRADAKKSQGPIWARALGVTMVRPEHEFCMQVDAHVDFVESFDVTLMQMWAQTENEYAVLSTYVGNLKQDLSAAGEVLIGHPQYEIPIICDTIKGGYGAVRNNQARAARCLSRPLLSLSWAAGWSFARCHFERNVPNDPFLGGMFDGEEFSRQLRLWTHGYDTYTPHRPVVFHDYTHGRPWQQGRESTWYGNHLNITAAVERYESLVEKSARQDLGVYGLGAQRTIDQYIDFAAIDPRTSEHISKDRCGRLPYVPFREDTGKVRTAVPEYPQTIPGQLTLRSNEDLLPSVDPEFVEHAQSMRTELQRKLPAITTEQQRRELGSSRVFWDEPLRRLREASAGGELRLRGAGDVEQLKLRLQTLQTTRVNAQQRLARIGTAPRPPHYLQLPAVAVTAAAAFALCARAWRRRPQR